MTVEIHAQQSPSQIQAKGAFDTRYASTDVRVIAFDDGVKTYISLPGDMRSQPVAVSVQTGRESLVPVTPMSPYWMLEGVHAKIKLLWSNNKIVQITYTGALESSNRLGSPAAFGHVQPAALHAAVPAPLPVNPKAAEEISAEIQGQLKKIADRDSLQAGVMVDPASRQANVDLQTRPEAASSQTPRTTQSGLATTTPPEPSPAVQTPAAQQPQSAQVFAAPSPVHFGIESGQRLSVALQAWLAAQGVSLVWDVIAGGERLRDIEMISEWHSPTSDIEKTLAQLLPAFGLRAIVQDNPRAVIVRSASGSAVKTTGAAK